MKRERNQWLSSEKKLKQIQNEDQGYKLVEIYECQWLRMTRIELAVHQFLVTKFQRPLDHCQTLNEKQVLFALEKSPCLELWSVIFVYRIILTRSSRKCVLFSRTPKFQDMTLGSTWKPLPRSKTLCLVLAEV